MPTVSALYVVTIIAALVLPIDLVVVLIGCMRYQQCTSAHGDEI